MTPTADLRSKLRLYIDEIIPNGGTDTDTRFTEAELDDILSEAADIYSAASEAWFRKAARAMSERGGLEENSAGDERHKFVSIEAYRDHCLQMSSVYARMAGSRSRVMAFEPPDVLGGESDGCY